MSDTYARLGLGTNQYLLEEYRFTRMVQTQTQSMTLLDILLKHPPKVCPRMLV